MRLDSDTRRVMRTATRIGIIALGMVLIFIAIMVGLSTQWNWKCRVERVNCRPAVRFGWDRGPVAYPDTRCEERCR